MSASGPARPPALSLKNPWVHDQIWGLGLRDKNATIADVDVCVVITSNSIITIDATISTVDIIIYQSSMFVRHAVVDVATSIITEIT